MADNSQEQKDEQLKKDIENVEKSGIDSEKKDGVHKVKESRGKVIFDAFDHIKKREFKEAANLLIKATATFSATEICSLRRFIFLTVICVMMTESRERIKNEVYKSADVRQVVEEMPSLKVFLNSFVECNYREYTRSYIAVIEEVKADDLLKQHVLIVQRTLRLRAYQQYLQPFRSVKLQVMANSFGLSVPFLEQEIGNFVAAGKLSVKIDRVDGSILAIVPEKRDALYKEILTEGDGLLNKLQNLSRVLGM